MNTVAAILKEPAEADLETGESEQAIGLAPKPRTFRRSAATTVDLLLVHSPTAHPLPSRNGVRRWEYRGRVYREISLETLYAWDDENQSTRDFHQTDSLMRAKPHRGRAA